MANIVVAYIFWLLGGPFGLHHFYLGRDKHAFVWYISFGGLLLGWFRDLWRLPEYVYQANNDPAFLREFEDRRHRHKKPPFSVTRFAGQCCIGILLGYLFRLAIPEGTLGMLHPFIRKTIGVLLPLFGTTVGVKLVANIGTQLCHFKWCFLGAAISIPWLLGDQPPIAATALFASISASCKTEWDTSKVPPRGACKCVKRALVFGLCCSLYLSLWCSVIAFNVQIDYNGEKISISEAVENFFKSPAWKDFRKSVGLLYEFCQQHGWEHCYNEFLKQVDPSGERNAYEVLELDNGASEEEIRSQCRKALRKWHPDKARSEEEKKIVAEKFMEVQQACELLDKMRKRRNERNLKSDTSPKDKQPKHTEF